MFRGAHTPPKKSGYTSTPSGVKFQFGCLTPLDSKHRAPYSYRGETMRGKISQILIVFVVSISANFFLPRLIPGDPITAALLSRTSTGQVVTDIDKVIAIYKTKYGLDQPLLVQFKNYLVDLATLNLGTSLADPPQSVISKIWDSLPWTFGLLFVATIVAFSVGSLLGAAHGWGKAKRLTSPLMTVLTLFSSIPGFLLGFLIVALFSQKLGLLPAAGGHSPTLRFGWTSTAVLDILKHGVAPALCIVLSTAGFWAIQMRSMTLTVKQEDFVKFAEAKGLSESRIFFKYGVRNALLPQITNLGLALSSIISGSVLIESFFSYPGLGGLLRLAIFQQDYFVVQGIVVMLIVSVTVVLLVIELINPLLDPTIRANS